MKGSYLLIIKLENDSIIRIGKLGEIKFNKGFYVYVGSALNSLEKRINRHIGLNKKIHWHIDYLLEHAKIIDVFYKEKIVKEECIIAKTFEKIFTSIPSFGCSDCTCKSHIFYGTYDGILKVINKLNMKLFSSNANC